MALAGILSARSVAPFLVAAAFTPYALNALQILGALVLFVALAAHLRFSWYADTLAAYSAFDVKNSAVVPELPGDKTRPSAEQAMVVCTCLRNKQLAIWWRNTIVGPSFGFPTASVLLLMVISVASGLVTRTALTAAPNMPVAFAAVTSMATVIWLLPVFVCYPASCSLRASMIPALAVATLMCFLDLAATTVALPLLSLPLQQLLSALIPSATVVLETCYQCKAKPALLYAAICMLTVGSAVVLLGAFGTSQNAKTQPPQLVLWVVNLLSRQTDETAPALVLGAMALALLTTSVKFILLRGIQQSNRELGVLSLLFWCQVPWDGRTSPYQCAARLISCVCLRLCLCWARRTGLHPCLCGAGVHCLWRGWG